MCLDNSSQCESLSKIPSGQYIFPINWRNRIFPFVRLRLSQIQCNTHLNWPVSQVRKPTSLPREEIRIKLAAGQTLCCAHLAGLAEIQGKVMAQTEKKDYDMNCPE